MGIGDYSFEQLPYSMMEIGMFQSALNIPIGIIIGRSIRRWIWKVPFGIFSAWKGKATNAEIGAITLLAAVTLILIFVWPAARLFLSVLPVFFAPVSVLMIALSEYLCRISSNIEDIEYRAGVLFSLSFFSIYLFWLLKKITDTLGLPRLLFFLLLLFLAIASNIDSLTIDNFFKPHDFTRAESASVAILIWAFIEIFVFAYISPFFQKDD